MSTKALIILSGGQDSTTCLYWAKKKFDEVHAITFDYGQRHKAEIAAARSVAQLAGVASHQVLEVGSILRGSSPLVSNNSLEQYSGMYALPGGLEKTFVPGRNLLFLTLAANHAYALGITDLVTGVCQEDYGGYPDCRAIFINLARDTLAAGLAYDDNDPFKNIQIHTPLMFLSKAESVKLAKELGDECWAALRYTHTAYDGQYPPVGSDHATLLRAKGFYEAGLPDPLVLRAFEEGLMELPDTDNYNEVRESYRNVRG